MNPGLRMLGVFCEDLRVYFVAMFGGGGYKYECRKSIPRGSEALLISLTVYPLRKKASPGRRVFFGDRL